MNLEALDSRRHAQDLRNTWQARCLAESRGRAAAVVLAVLFHNYRDAMQVLLRVVYPKAPLARNGWTEIARPFLYGGATITADGKVVCGMIDGDGQKVPNALLYESEFKLIWEMLKLADRLVLTDAERIELTEAVKRWVVADRRINHMGERRAS